MKLEDSKAGRYITSVNADECDFEKASKMLKEEFPNYNILVMDLDDLTDEEKEEFIVSCIQNKCLVDFQSEVFETKDCEMLVKVICMLTENKED